jgi:hypothetical protein
MDESIVSQLVSCFKSAYGVELDSPRGLLQMQQDLLEFVMGLGRKLENSLVAHGLFGIIRYRRAYYRREGKEGGSWVPLDEKLGIEKKHTPGMQYMLSGFTAAWRQRHRPPPTDSGDGGGID